MFLSLPADPDDAIEAASLNPTLKVNPVRPASQKCALPLSRPHHLRICQIDLPRLCAHPTPCASAHPLPLPPLGGRLALAWRAPCPCREPWMSPRPSDLRAPTRPRIANRASARHTCLFWLIRSIDARIGRLWSLRLGQSDEREPSKERQTLISDSSAQFDSSFDLTAVVDYLLLFSRAARVFCVTPMIPDDSLEG